MIGLQRPRITITSPKSCWLGVVTPERETIYRIERTTHNKETTNLPTGIRIWSIPISCFASASTFNLQISYSLFFVIHTKILIYYLTRTSLSVAIFMRTSWPNLLCRRHPNLSQVAIRRLWRCRAYGSGELSHPCFLLGMELPRGSQAYDRSMICREIHFFCCLMGLYNLYSTYPSNSLSLGRG